MIKKNSFFRTNTRVNNIADVFLLAMRQTHFLTFEVDRKKLKKRQNERNA